MSSWFALVKFGEFVNCTGGDFSRRPDLHCNIRHIHHTDIFGWIVLLCGVMLSFPAKDPLSPCLVDMWLKTTVGVSRDMLLVETVLSPPKPPILSK